MTHKMSDLVLLIFCQISIHVFRNLHLYEFKQVCNVVKFKQNVSFAVEEQSY